MATIDIQSVTKSFGEVEVIPALDLQVNDGEFVVLVGPIRVRQDHHAANDRWSGDCHVWQTQYRHTRRHAHAPGECAIARWSFSPMPCFLT